LRTQRVIFRNVIWKVSDFTSLFLQLTDSFRLVGGRSRWP